MDTSFVVYGFLIGIGLFVACWFLFVAPTMRRDHERRLALVQKRLAKLEASRAAAVPDAADAVVETPRLRLREMTPGDAEFILAMLTDADFLRYIGDRGVHTLDEASAYLEQGPIDSYRRHGYGLYLVEAKADGTALGMCGLLRREGLDHPDIGFAFLPRYRSQGYASEATAAVLDFSQRVLALPRILAVATPDNVPSNRLLVSAGMRLDGTVRLPEDDTELNLYVYEA